MSTFCYSLAFLLLLLFLGLFLSHVAFDILPVDHIAKYWINSTVFTLTGIVAILVAAWAVWQYKKIGSTKDKKEAAGIKAIMYVATGLFIMALSSRMIDWLNAWITSV